MCFSCSEFRQITLVVRRSALTLALFVAGLPEWSSLRGFNRHFGKLRLVATRSELLPVAVLIRRQWWKRTYRAGPGLRLRSTNASRSDVRNDSQSPAGKPPTKAGWGRQRLSPGGSVSSWKSVSRGQSVRAAGMSADQQCLHQLASIGAPGVASPNGCQPTKAGRMPDRSAREGILSRGSLLKSSSRGAH